MLYNKNVLIWYRTAVSSSVPATFGFIHAAPHSYTSELQFSIGTVLRLSAMLKAMSRVFVPTHHFPNCVFQPVTCLVTHSYFLAIIDFAFAFSS